jgi:hypothetical protein
MTLRPRLSRRDERGIALSSPLALLSVGAVLVAGAAFVVTGGDEPAREAATPVVASPTPTARAAAPSPTAKVAAAPKKKKRPVAKPVVRRDAYVEVYNNSGISGLAGSTAARAQGAGWQVVGSDNWYGTVQASTVYFPSRFQAQATLLAHDLGIGRVRPSIAPMRGDRLTVILTRDYS